MLMIIGPKSDHRLALLLSKEALQILLLKRIFSQVGGEGGYPPILLDDIHWKDWKIPSKDQAFLSKTLILASFFYG